MWQIFLTMVLLFAASLSIAQERAAEITRAPYERILKDDDAVRAEQLQEQIDELQAAANYVRAIPLAKAILDLRRKEQGDDHWETVDAANSFAALEKIGTLPPETRKVWQEAWNGLLEAELFESKGQYLQALPLYIAFNRRCVEVFGEEHPCTAASSENLAANLMARMKYSEARSLIEKVLVIRRKAFGEWHPQTAASYDDLALVLRIQGKYAEAQPLSLKALDIRLKALGDNHPETVASYESVAMNLDAQSDFTAAAPLLQKALVIRRKLFGEESPETATGYSNIAGNLNGQGKYADALSASKKALAIRRKAFGEEHLDTAVAYYEVAHANSMLGKYSEAEPLYKKSIEILRLVRGDGHLDAATVYNDFARNLNAQGKHADAQRLYATALNIRQNVLGEEHRATATTYSDAALNLQSQGKNTEAQLLFEKALNTFIKTLGENNRDTAAAYSNLALNLSQQAKYAEAQLLNQKALYICLSILGEEHPDTASIYNNVALTLRAQGKCSEALPLFVKSLGIVRQALGDEHATVALLYNNIGVILDELGRISEAELALQYGLDISRKVLGDNHPVTATLCNSLATVLTQHKKHSEAEPLLQKALEIRRRRLGDENSDTALSYNNLGVNLDIRGEHDRALPLLKKSLDIQRKALGDGHPRTALSHMSLAANSLCLGKTAAAEIALQSSVRSYEVSRLIGAVGLERAHLKVTNPRVMLATLEAAREPATAWMTIEMCFGRGLLDEDAAHHRLTSTLGETAVQSLWRGRLTSAQSQILVLSTRPDRTADESQQLNNLILQRQTAEEKLADIAVEISQREVASPAAIRASIPPKSALIFWADATDKSGKVNEHWGCVVRSEGEPKWERSRGTGSEGQWIRADTELPGMLRGALANLHDSSDVNGLVKTLRDVRLAPLTRHLDGTETLYVVSTHAMAGIPVETLTSDYVISYIPSGTFLARLKDSPRPTGNRLLAVGDPVFAGTKEKQQAKELPSLAVRGDDWMELPGTRAELNQLTRLFGNLATVLVDSYASEQSLEDLRKNGELARYRYLHFATHGEGNDARAFESALILSQDKLPEAMLPKAGEPFINGQLSAREVLDYWKLDAELVTLSACETAIGHDGGGDGMLGFAQAFLTAGARAVCLSLWQVDDRATSLLMTRFYQNLLGKRPGLDKPMGKAAALHEAKSWLRELTAEEVDTLTAEMNKDVTRGDRAKGKTINPIVPAAETKKRLAKNGTEKPFANPHYWAAFILIGDPN
jgi:CHAT domain-containing protein/tetratricopeptide (TPR) repeat protein